MNKIQDQIALLLDQTATELSSLVRQSAMEAVEAAFEGNGHARTARRTAPRAASRAARTTTSATAPASGAVLAYIKKNPGTSSEAARTALGLDRDDWRAALADLGTKLRKKGQKRGTTYTAK